MSVLQTSTFNQERSNECLVTPRTSSQSKKPEQIAIFTVFFSHLVYNFPPTKQKTCCQISKVPPPVPKTSRFPPQKTHATEASSGVLYVPRFTFRPKKSSILECSRLPKLNNHKFPTKRIIKKMVDCGLSPQIFQDTLWTRRFRGCFKI